MGAREEKVLAVKQNNTWDLVQLPFNKSVVGSSKAYTVKVNPYGPVARLKATLVTKGYSQTYGVDY